MRKCSRLRNILTCSRLDKYGDILPPLAPHLLGLRLNHFSRNCCEIFFRLIRNWDDYPVYYFAITKFSPNFFIADNSTFDKKNVKQDHQPVAYEHFMVASTRTTLHPLPEDNSAEIFTAVLKKTFPPLSPFYTTIF